MKKLWCAPAALLLAVLLPAGAANAQTREDARLITATQVMEELRASPDQNIPSWLMERAYGVAVIPEVIKGALIFFGGRHGNGVLTVRDDAGRFSSPIFISLNGGSVGWQLGAQSTDVVLVFATRRSVENFARGQFTLGGSASVAAGPVGRQAEASAGVNSEIYSYSRARGLFAGVAFDGTALLFEGSANRNFYGRKVTTDDIITGKATSNSESARRFIAAVAAGIPAASAGAAASQAGATTTPAVSTPATAPAPIGGGAQSFPMEDRKPGGEPR
jgi:lipid-binding SYLF domain-containing protein